MGFLDKAKAAATELSAKADQAMSQAGISTPGATSSTSASAERHLRDLGVIAYLEATGRQAPDGERERVLGALRDAEQQGGLGSLTLRTTPPPPPPPPGMAGTTGTTAPPPPPAGTKFAPTQPTQPPSESAPPPPPPPPPSWS